MNIISNNSSVRAPIQTTLQNMPESHARMQKQNGGR
jgi:hypothetical protein